MGIDYAPWKLVLKETKPHKLPRETWLAGDFGTAYYDDNVSALSYIANVRAAHSNNIVRYRLHFPKENKTNVWEQATNPAVDPD